MIVAGCNVSVAVIDAALSSVIAQGLEEGSRGGAAIAIETAVYAGHMQAVTSGLAQVSWNPFL